MLQFSRLMPQSAASTSFDARRLVEIGRALMRRLLLGAREVKSIDEITLRAATVH